MSHTTFVSAVSGSLQSPRWPRQTCGMKSSLVFCVFPVSACPAASRAQIRAQIRFLDCEVVAASLPTGCHPFRCGQAADVATALVAGLLGLFGTAVRGMLIIGTLWDTRVLRGGTGLPAGRIEASPCRPGGSGVGLCLSGRGDDPHSDTPLFEGGPGVRGSVSAIGPTVYGESAIHLAEWR
jgi:hypothetical protein